MTELDQLLPLREAVPAPLPSSSLSRPEERIRVIEPGRSSLKNLGRDLWEYRELLYFLTWRDIKVRYKQTVLGILWAIIQPVMSMIVLSICFGQFAGLGKHTGGVAYPIFVYAGLLPWTFFANALGAGSGSVVGNTNLVTKVHCPRIMLPISAVAGGLVDLAISFVVLFALMVWYHVPLAPRLLVTPLLVLGVSAIASGFAA